ncbi:Ig-like domain repeat protein [Haloferax mediterranei ATCC 33500]|uniref:Ig-like domain repeat protein n=1 Tax=Haloferax mediterranei (strain ATCC 33500 / DSM 1411 / JCM 8866 / NBRC 14739 / NCIMB 2177 / R-4) TaxID=523841 RepID=I3R464_HALMT|nr:Ig-like domain-containing protein [Haloferax mediterranei]AFK19024.1 hypothetical protein HFX_1313 [Haloferax mediterranei ATCC 33500]AHZ21616.1 hypothetical protein BM92_02620 [Haloferax mediterranei ATCC 33500]EMA03533.1 hypothetical protein C439_03940 [Haloferax mediterranei ATCC 33500]MDX5989118.1 Ig-like domain-containing protein [Haloferax mediterranei ATCC 33500]QCQ75501.1 Ig-like domain repeat protein [Haloferax mediterranei ATCC 33500]
MDTTYSSGGEGYHSTGVGSSDVLFDRSDAKVGGSSTIDATYVGSSHKASDIETGFVDLDLTNASATITWQGSDDGSTWSNITSTTISASANETTDLSTTSYSQYRVRVDATDTGSDASATIYEEGVLFNASTPATVGGTAIPADDSTIRFSNTTLSIDVTDADFATTQGDSVTAEFFVDGTSVGSDTLTSNGTVSVATTGLAEGDHSWHVEVEDSYGETSSSSTRTFEVDHFEPVVNNSSLTPEDGSQLTSQTVNLSAEVTDSDFQFDGDSLTVEFVVDGSVVGTDTLSSNGTATYTYDAGSGSFDWNVQVSDQYGTGVDTVSATQSVASPSTVYIRNVSSGSLITETASVEARLFSGEEIFSKNATNGTIDLTGVSPGQGYILQLRVDDYVLRTIAVRSIYEQQTAYLLPENESTVYNEFHLADNTNEFDTSETVLYVERPIDKNGTLEWRTVTGDYFGSDGVFKTTLEKDQRYQLTIENNDGDRRELGSYIAAANTSATLTVGEIVWKSPSGDTYQWDAYIDKEDDPHVFKFVYSDPEDQTTALNVTVFERGNESNVLLQTNQTGSISSFQRSEPLSTAESQTQWIVNFTATRNGSVRPVQEPISGVSGVNIPVDQRWATLGGYLLVIGIGALFPSTMARAGAVTVVAVATGLSWLGLVPIPIEVIGLGGAIALLGVVAEFNSRY